MDEKNYESFLELRKRRVGPLMEQEELQRTQKRRMPQQTSVLTLSDLRKIKEDQVEKYIQDLETKNKTLLAKITELSSVNKQLSDENVELCNKFNRPADSSSLQNCPVKNSVNQVFRKPKTGSYELEHSAQVLTTQALVALWEEVSSIPLPQCNCSKSQAVVRRRANFKTKKYRAYKA